MSEKRPPPRPPLPRQGSGPRSGKSNTNTPGRLRSALASISIRYNPTSAKKDSDSEEEISIVRKTHQSCEGGNHNSAISENENSAVTQTPGTVTPEPNHTEPKQTQPATEQAPKSSGAIDNGGGRKVVKQKTWPLGSGNSVGEHSSSEDSTRTTSMRFLRRDAASKSSNDQSKSEETVDSGSAGSQPSKTQLSLNDRDREQPRSRSPSPFRRLNRQANQETGERLAATTSSISLSSLLAAAAKHESSAELEKENTELVEETDDFHDALPELSPPSRLSNYEDEELQYTFEAKEVSVSQTPHDPPFAALSVCTLLTYTYYITTPPIFVNGMVFGFLVAYLVGCVVLWLMCPEDSDKERFDRELGEYNWRLARAPVREYSSIDPGLLLRPRELKGWLNKAYHYDTTTASETTPVLAQLKGAKLTLSHPKLTPTNKPFDPRTASDESAAIQFNRYDYFDVTGARVSLVPPSITKKRIWSKKYPICIMFEKPAGVSEEVKEVFSDETGKPTLQKMKSQSSFEGISILYLFARTGREKEEWFQHFSKIANSKKEETVSDLDYLLRPSCSYPHYMARLLPVPDESKQESQQVQLAWVNMLFGRVFWDVWQDRYWADKITQRFQNKLSKLHKPQFIRDIRITDLCLGNSLPIINRVSPPVLDERGTWIDVDITYSGGLVFTLETYLNVEGYLSYFLNLGNQGQKDISADLEMAELSRKYEMLEREECAKEDNDDEDNEENESLTSESPPESDSDFESPESDIEELTKLLDSRPNSSETESASEITPENSYNGVEFRKSQSLESTSDKDVVEDPLEEASGTSLSSPVSSESLERSDSVPEHLSDSGRFSPIQKQSSNEETPEKRVLSPPLSPTSESAPASPAKRVVHHHPKQGTKKKLFSVIERLAKSKWVKKAAETKIVKSAAERFSNLPIILSLEVQTVKGTLAINIPPPPTNRLWYGFRGNPMLFVSARPKLGARQVKLTHVTDWIEKKLKQEFKNMFVLPNMEDLQIRLMNCDIEKQFGDH